MKHKLIFLNLALAAITAAAGWRLREDWLRDHAHATTVIGQRVNPLPPPAIIPVAPPAPFVSPTYLDVAQKNLFSKDRNPNVFVEPVVVKPEEPMPALPLLTGVMGLPSGMVALLAEKPNERSHGVAVGESIGAFKLVALNTEKVSFEWKGKTVEKKVDELIDRSSHEQPAAAAAAAQNAAVNPANAVPNRNAAPPVPKPGIDVGAQMKSCQPGDTSPAGTLADGYKKVVERTPFGDACRWVAAN